MIYLKNIILKKNLLREIIEETVEFNRNLEFEYLNDNVNLISSVEDLIGVYRLRSEVYTDIGYQDEFPDTIKGLNFDIYDKKSAVLFCKTDKKTTGTTRLIFDSKNKLPSESKFSFDAIRKKYNIIGELSRLIIKQKKKGLNIEFKNLTSGVYNVYLNNDINIIVSGIKQEHYKLYSKFGGFEIEKELNGYGKVDAPAYITSWNPALVSSFFKRAFL